MAAVKPVNNLVIAISSILLAVLALSFGDALIKQYSVSFPIWQIYILRSVMALPVLLLLIGLSKTKVGLIPHSIKWVGLRSLLLGTMWMAYYFSLPHIDLTVAAAVYYTIPIFITLLSALVIRESITPLAWFAVILGFISVLIIIRPGAAGFNLYVLLPLLAAVCYAFAMIITRVRCQSEDPRVLSIALNLMFVALGGALLLFRQLGAQFNLDFSEIQNLVGPWLDPYGSQWLIMWVLSLVVIVGSVFSAIAYQRASPPVLATFDYFYLGFSIVWGVVIFSEQPDGLTLLGIGLLVVSGIMAIWQRKEN